jgi:hypothetical protein
VGMVRMGDRAHLQATTPYSMPRFPQKFQPGED